MSIINYLRLSRTDSDELSVITAKQGDNLGDVCQIEVYDNQTIVKLSDYDDIMFYANKPDKSSILFRISDGNNNFVRNNNTLNLTFTDTLLAVHGTVECEISFYKGNEIKSTYNFNIYVFKSPGTYDNLNVSDLETIKNSVSKVVEAETTVTESIKSAKEAEINASASATASANSASSALSSANIATTKATEAATSAESAALSATTATDKANNASQSASNASNSANSAKISETNAKTSENNSKTYANNASASATSSENSAKLSESWAIGGTNTRTGEDTDNSKYYAEQSSTYATNAKVSETNSKASETNCKISEDNAKTYMSNASASASEASTSSTNAKVSETNAENFASLANTSADIATSKANEALISANSAATSATEAESFTHGNGTRENDNIDNAKYYYQQAKAISESFSGALRPMGTVAFNDLPSIDTVTAGDMYNISDEFITTSDFKEGSGLTIPAGSNIYKTSDGKWDILAGSPVTGIKGNAENTYRKGNVNITPANIGAVATDGDVSNTTATFTEASSRTNITTGEKLSTLFGKIKKWFSDLKAVAFSGSYNDLSDKPSSLPASDVYSWAKASSKPSYSYSEISGTPSSLPANGGNADTVDGEHAYVFAHCGTDNNLISHGNEFNFASSEFSGDVWFNYRTAGGTNGNITEYFLGNGKGSSLGSIIHSGNISSQSVNYASSAGNADTLDGNHSSAFAAASHTHAYIPTSASCNKNWDWAGKSGQPNWLWGSNDGSNCYVWNPSNFSVSYATNAGYATSAGSAPASDVYSWAKQSSKPSYSWSEINDKPSTFAPASHSHDDSYYTKSETTSKMQDINNRIALSEGNISDILDKLSSNRLKFTWDGASLCTYIDGTFIGYVAFRDSSGNIH